MSPGRVCRSCSAGSSNTTPRSERRAGFRRCRRRVVAGGGRSRCWSGSSRSSPPCSWSALAPASQQALAAGTSGVVAVQTRQIGPRGRDSAGRDAGFAGRRRRFGVGGGPEAGAVSRVDPESGVVVDRIPVGGEPGSIAYGGGAVWVASTIGRPSRGSTRPPRRSTHTIHLPGANPVAIAYGAGRVWVADSSTARAVRDRPGDGMRWSGRVAGSAAERDRDRGRRDLGRGYDDATVEKLDPHRGGCSARVRVGDGPAALAFGAGSLWVANSLDSTVSRIEPASLEGDSHDRGRERPDRAGRRRGRVWVANQYSGTVSRIDPRRDRVAASVAVGGAPTSLTVSGGTLWVGVAANPGSHRGGTLVIVTTTKFSTRRATRSPRSTRRSTTTPATRSSWDWPTTRWSPSSRPRGGWSAARSRPRALDPDSRATAARHTRSGSVPGSATQTASRCAPATFVARSSVCSASARQDVLRSTDIVGGRHACPPHSPRPLPRDRHRRSRPGP